MSLQEAYTMARTLASNSEQAAPSSHDEHRGHGYLVLARWPLLAAGVAGLVSWISADRLRVSREAFLLPYVLSACVLCLIFVRAEHVDFAEALRRNPVRTTIATLLTAAITITTVLLQRGAPRAHGARLAFEIAWDGVAYGAVDGLMLTVIPMASIARLRAAPGRATDVLALLASVFVFIVYHLGFPEFRGAGLVAPVIASIMFGAAFLFSRNPLAPILAHAAMHIVAVLHGPAGTVQLPPHY
jgi:hypothetical protein